VGSIAQNKYQTHIIPNQHLRVIKTNKQPNTRIVN
jgi:hypothetical protein